MIVRFHALSFSLASLSQSNLEREWDLQSNWVESRDRVKLPSSLVLRGWDWESNWVESGDRVKHAVQFTSWGVEIKRAIQFSLERGCVTHVARIVRHRLQTSWLHIYILSLILFVWQPKIWIKYWINLDNIFVYINVWIHNLKVLDKICSYEQHMAEKKATSTLVRQKKSKFLKVWSFWAYSSLVVCVSSHSVPIF